MKLFQKNWLVYINHFKEIKSLLNVKNYYIHFFYMNLITSKLLSIEIVSDDLPSLSHHFIFSACKLGNQFFLNAYIYDAF